MTNPNQAEDENKDDREFLEKMGIATGELVYPERVPTEEQLRLELRWRMILARG